MKKKNRVHIWELVCSVLMLFLIVAGIYFQYTANNEAGEFITEINVKKYASLVLQIQASVSTLTVALLALLSGIINQEIHGLGLAQYFMNFRFWIYKQKTIIISAISLTFIGVIFFFTQNYILVYMSFFLEWILIIFSVFSLFPIFVNLEESEKEIRNYLISQWDKSITKTKTINQIRSFLSTWEKTPKSVYSNEKNELLKRVVQSGMRVNNKDGVGFLNENISPLISSFLSDNDPQVIKKGLRLLEEVYEWMREEIVNNNDDYNSVNDSPQILNNVLHELHLAFKHLDFSTLTESFDFSTFSINVAIVLANYANDNEKLTNDLGYLEWLGRMHCSSIGEERTEGEKIRNPDRYQWKAFLMYPLFELKNVPTNYQETVQLHRCLLYFNYIVQLINDGNSEIVKDGFYNGGYYTIAKDNQYDILLHLSVQCYLYYLAVEENPKIVSSVTRESADLLLRSQEVKQRFNEYLNVINWNRFKEVDFRRSLNQLLDRFEILPLGEAKWCIMSNVVENWYWALILFAHYNGLFFGDFFSLLRRDYDSLFQNIVASNEETTKTALFTLFQLFSASDASFSKDYFDTVYSDYRSLLIDNYKEFDKERLSDIQSAFENDSKALQNRLEEDIDKVLKEKTSRFPMRHFEVKKEIKHQILKIYLPTDFLVKSNNENNGAVLKNVDGILCNSVCNYLIDNGNLEIYNRDNDTDEEFIQLLKNRGIRLIYGSKKPLLKNHFHNKQLLNEFVDDRNSIFTTGSKACAVLWKDDLNVSIQNFNVSIENGVLTAENYPIDPETRKYKVELAPGVETTFEKEELEEYIRNKDKTISISLDVLVQHSEGILGLYIVQDDKRSIAITSEQ